MNDFGSRAESIWLNVVWSKAVLNRHTAEELRSVLDPEFYNKVICEKNLLIIHHVILTLSSFQMPQIKRTSAPC